MSVPQTELPFYPYQPIQNQTPSQFVPSREAFIQIEDIRRIVCAIRGGATQESIESHTFPHKYKRVRIFKFF